MNAPIKIALVEDNPDLRKKMSQRLAAQEQLSLVLTAVNGQDFLYGVRALPKQQQPEVVLMDIEMDTMDGIMATAFCKKEFPDCQVIMLTVFDEEDKVFEAIRAGACGYLLKGERFENILSAIAYAQEGGSWMSPAIARKTLNYLRSSLGATQQQSETPPLAKVEQYLSAREIEVLSLLVQGMPLPKVAEQLFISYGTVRTHVRRIYEKLQVSNKVEATQLAMKNKWFSKVE